MRTLKKLVRSLPITSGLQEWYGKMKAEKRTDLIIQTIASSPYRQGAAIATAISSIRHPPNGIELEDINAIELLRREYLMNNDILADGTLGEPGIYDKGVTISDAFKVSKSPKPAMFLYMLVRALKPETVLELGTNTGISSAFIAMALKRNGKGKIVTLDSSPYRQRIAKNVHQSLGLEKVNYVNGLFVDTLDGVLEGMRTVDLAFIDGHHQYQPTLDYFAQIMPFTTSDSVFVFDDIIWSDGMKRAWAEIQHDDRTGLAIDLSSVGLTTLRNKEVPGTHVMEQLHLL